jgi:acyl carrier protein
MTDKISQIKQWVLSRNQEIDDILPDQDLIESRLVDSLSFTELLILIQQLSGEIIDQSSLDIEDFRTLNAIANRYFAVTIAG